MGKPHPMELRVRVVAFANEGNSDREVAGISGLLYGWSTHADPAPFLWFSSPAQIGPSTWQ
ncbi:hypothetical protein [Rhizobium oryzicola]|uniref:Uncharacterized protein n=1 Tax=Rhizobium oryzicola TaxID=1232668 RepID=A0ABT8SWL8_9HYPH|nr:hypothetical protein [Rhizobium oryzicola]MDO1582559.1 hypothetical protein [Rhizobium oryzicola]